MAKLGLDSFAKASAEGEAKLPLTTGCCRGTLLTAVTKQESFKDMIGKLVFVRDTGGLRGPYS